MNSGKAPGSGHVVRTVRHSDALISGDDAEKQRSAIQQTEEYYRALSRIYRFRNKEAMLRELLKHLADSDRNQLAAEKRKADLLLNNILPSYMIQELKKHGRVPPAHHENAYILITDFVGFSSISRYMSPRELLRELTIYFDAFEEICETYGLEKVKTIGDSLLCVGGVRKKSRTTHIDSVLAAMELLRFTYRRKKEKQARGDDAWGMRVVVHCGPLVAGVVGHSKIAFDIWGHSVNVASRIETVAREGVITTSEAMYQKIRDFFDCSFEGEHELKGTGRSDLFTVNGLRPEFTPEDPEGSSLYNDRFETLYDSVAMGHHVMRKDARYHIVKKKGVDLPPGVKQKRRKRLSPERAPTDSESET
ncbi:MAG: adenylate/guanylate cyclase domain-containing protein [bacterium]|nr:adenylate/guanylate cyclase domain-containing protein [bacterium]